MLIKRLVDDLLNSITMYRLMLYGLSALAFIALVLSLFNIISFSPLSLIFSFFILTGVCYGVNILLGYIFKIPVNIESSVISGLILFFLLAPPSSLTEMYPLALVSILAMVSKYSIAIKYKHVFNPVAIAAVIIGVFGSGIVIWWVGSSALLPFVIIIGLLVVRKIRRFYLFFSFLIASLVTMIIVSFSSGQVSFEILKQMVISWPLFFFGMIMLTEPATTPPTTRWQIAYGVLVGILFSSQFHIGRLYNTPELALVLGNIFSYFVSPKQRLQLVLQSSKKLSNDIYEFVFSGIEKLTFKAGQYMEWTLPLLAPDSRGNRRYFTIASAPTEKDFRLGIRVSTEHSSAFKKRLITLRPGENIWAGQLAGNFILPTAVQEKLVFIAGGIGITPFRSMIQFLLDREERRDIILFYAYLSPEHFVYQDIFSEAEKKLGIKIKYVITDINQVPLAWSGLSGYITTEMITIEVPDYKERMFYLSGPNAMVENYSKLLASLGIKKQRIKKDYFPGF